VQLDLPSDICMVCCCERVPLYDGRRVVSTRCVWRGTRHHRYAHLTSVFR